MVLEILLSHFNINFIRLCLQIVTDIIKFLLNEDLNFVSINFFLFEISKTLLSSCHLTSSFYWFKNKHSFWNNDYLIALSGSRNN